MRGFEEEEWRDSIVIVERGEIELECSRGARRSFQCGTVLWLVDLSLRAIHNPGPIPAVLVAISRNEEGGIDGS